MFPVATPAGLTFFGPRTIPESSCSLLRVSLPWALQHRRDRIRYFSSLDADDGTILVIFQRTPRGEKSLGSPAVQRVTGIAFDIAQGRFSLRSRMTRFWNGVRKARGN